MTAALTEPSHSWQLQHHKTDSLPGLPLFSERLKVRLFCREDEARRQAWAKFAEPYLAKYNFVPRRFEANQINFQRLRDRIRLAVDDPTGQLVGYVSLKPIEAAVPTAELGICFAADRIGQGYGREALGLVLPWAKEMLALHRIILQVDEVNRRALNLYRTFGFKIVGETWNREDNPALRALLCQRGDVPGCRWKNNHLEVLSWIMEWKPDEAAD